MRKHSFWLAGVIILTIIAFLYVFRPITFSPRKDSVDADRYLRPVGTKVGSWDAESSQQNPTFRLGGNTPVYIYKPTHDISLGLDLRGGMRVVLEIANRAEFSYRLAEPINNINERGRKQAQLANALQAAFGEDTDVQVELALNSANITTNADTLEKTKEQIKTINGVLSEIFGEGKFTAPEAEKAFKPVTASDQSDVLGIMEKRIDPNGVRELNAYAKGQNQVVLEIPGEKNPDEVLRLLGRTAELNFMLLAQDMTVSQGDDGIVSIYRGSASISDEEALKSAIVVARGRDLDPNSIGITYDNQGGLAVSFGMKTAARGDFAAMTGANVGRQMAIVLEGLVTSAPTIQSKIEGSGIITGNYTEKQARELQNLLKAGALPVKVKVLETRTISATLGQDSISKSLVAGLIGFMLVLVFMIAYYRLPGVMASLALLIYLFLVLAVIKFFGSTLTLPGIAGVIISFGMAVDANIIIFERLKEELKTNKPLPTALNTAYARALTAIIDSNVASIITGLVLYTLSGSGAVQNFAVTLIIGIVVSLFTAITVTRLFLELLIKSRSGHNLKWYGL